MWFDCQGEDNLNVCAPQHGYKPILLPNVNCGQLERLGTGSCGRRNQKVG